MASQRPRAPRKQRNATGLFCLPSFNCNFFRCSSSKVGNFATPGVFPDESSPDVQKLESPSTPRTEREVLANSSLRKFCFNDLKSATRNFRPDSLLGEGGFGYVFKGWVEENGTAPVRPGTGLVVAVKIMNRNGLQGHREWLAEIQYLGEIEHKHLVKLVGYCIEGDQRLLVYEFMKRGSLENHLFRKGAIPLAWETRMKVAWGAAKGLAYLHNRKTPIIFRDLKTSNILLDLEFNAKLSDFGLARDGPQGDKSHVTTRILGTHGYAAPEYVRTGHLTTQSDMYSYGVVLLEMLTGKRALDKTRPSGEQNLVEWARPCLNDVKKMAWLADPRLDGKYPGKAFEKMARLAARCLCYDPKRRPNIDEVLNALAPFQYVGVKIGFPAVRPPIDARPRLR